MTNKSRAAQRRKVEDEVEDKARLLEVPPPFSFKTCADVAQFHKYCYHHRNTWLQFRDEEEPENLKKLARLQIERDPRFKRLIETCPAKNHSIISGVMALGKNDAGIRQKAKVDNMTTKQPMQDNEVQRITPIQTTSRMSTGGDRTPTAASRSAEMDVGELLLTDPSPDIRLNFVKTE